MSIHLSTIKDYEDLFDKYDTWMFDCDGVLWHGDDVIEGATQVLNILRDRKKQLVFVTNNATKSRKKYKEKFDGLGIEAHIDEIYGSAYASAVYISSVMKMSKDQKVYVIGMSGIEEELREEGVSFIGGTDPADNTLEPFSLTNFTLDTKVAAVLCGLDTSINYTKLSKAYQYLTRNPGCQFLVTNEDSTYPVAGGTLPGSGSLSAPLRFALGRDPISIGKPASTMLDCIKAKVDFSPKRTIMIGDRLDTDILFGQNGGLTTLLVLTGVTAKHDLTKTTIVPDYVTSSINDLRADLDKRET